MIPAFPRALQETVIEPIIFENVAIPREALDPDAVRALTRLQRRGVESYLVGGCVRDLLLGLRPKDFDIATEARPRKVKTLFSNCRIIGRRFKLAHLQFNQKIIEVSTFRKTPEGPENGEPGQAEPDLLIREDNEFGNAEEDARRRDFTINGLFYDPERRRIIDYVGGLADLEQRAIRTIGDPWIRFREDPVRILRAVKFVSRLGFHASPETFQAMCDVAPDLVRSATPRVLEEVFRLLRSGTALMAFQMLRDVQALPVILPEVGDFLASASESEREVFWRHLEALDEWVHTHGEVPDNALLLAPLFYPVVCRRAPETDGHRLIQVVEDLVSGFALRMRLPRREAGRLKRICVVQRRFHLKGGGTGRRKFRPMLFVRQEYFDDALLLLYLHARATGGDLALHDEWRARQERARAEGLLPLPPRRHGDDEDDEPDLREVAEGLDEESGAEGDARPRAVAGGPSAEPWPQDFGRPADDEPRRETAESRPYPGDRGPRPDPERDAGRRDAGRGGQHHPGAGRDDDRRGDRGGRGGRRRRGRGRDRDRDRDRDRNRPDQGRQDAGRHDGGRHDGGRRDGGRRDGGHPQRQHQPQQHRPRPEVPESVPIVDPEALDLDPTQVPTFGSILRSQEVPAALPRPAGGEARRKPGSKKNAEEEPESYVPPPPPTFEPKPPPGADDEFGDW